MGKDRLWTVDERRRRGTGDGDGRQADRAPVSDPAEDPIPKINEREEARKQAKRDVNKRTYSIYRSVSERRKRYMSDIYTFTLK